jgi:hypothetical protein
MPPGVYEPAQIRTGFIDRLMGERMGKPVHYLPLYMTMCLAAERGEQALADTTLEAVSFEDLL